MWSLIQAAGWPIWPLIFASIIALALIFERMWSLRQSAVAPEGMVERVLAEYRQGDATPELVTKIAMQGPLGRVLAAGLINRHRERTQMKEGIEEVGRHVVFELGRYINVLGTIAAISPLLGLLGTVIGMIRIFGAVTKVGMSDPSIMAGGISEALVATATGLLVAIPAMMFYRYFNRRVEGYVVTMELEALKLVEVLHGERPVDGEPGGAP